MAPSAPAATTTTPSSPIKYLFVLTYLDGENRELIRFNSILEDLLGLEDASSTHCMEGQDKEHFFSSDLLAKLFREVENIRRSTDTLHLVETTALQRLLALIDPIIADGARESLQVIVNDKSCNFMSQEI